MRVSVRTWNVAHGRTTPPSPVGRLREMIELAVDDKPDVVCLQEVPPWSLPELASWSGYDVLGTVGRRAIAGPAARRLTAAAPGLFRSGLTGQALATLIRPSLMARSCERLVLNPLGVRIDRAGGLTTLLHWGQETRVAQVCAAALDGCELLICNLHLTHVAPRLAEVELARAEEAVRRASKGVRSVLCGDLNLSPASTGSFARLARSGWSEPAPGIDHILGRGLVPAAPARVWPPEARRSGDVLLSDHAPVDAELIAA